MSSNPFSPSSSGFPAANDFEESQPSITLSEALEKLAQAETYVTYQDNMISFKENEIIELQLSVTKLTNELENKNELIQQLTDQLTSVKKERSSSFSVSAIPSSPNLPASVSSPYVAKELEELRLKVQQAKEYIDYQTDAFNELVKSNTSLQQQLDSKDMIIESLKLKSSSSSSSSIAAFSPSTPASDPSLKATVDSLTEKLSQAADYIKYQEELVTTKDNDLIGCQQLLKIKLLEIERLEKIVSELETTKSLAAMSLQEKDELTKVRLKLEQAAEYINYQTDQLTHLQEENSLLQGKIIEKDSTMLILTKETSKIHEKEEKFREMINGIQSWNQLIQEKTEEMKGMLEKKL
jgi:chromosome segregation ATPase